MADRVIGLDIGTNAVRAAEVVLGARPEVVGFGQVALGPGAMRDGEVIAPDLVSAAIRRLWREVGFKRAPVRVGIASPRVIVRTIDMPVMPEAELAGALQFEVQEYIPIPVDDAILDFQIIEAVTNADGETVNRVLVAAAHRDVVTGVIAAVEGAGLRAAAVDLVPFALIRALASPTAPEGEAEAIVSIGADVTTVVVHEAGIPRIVRIVAVGGNVITDTISQDLGVPTETAEGLKRRVGQPAGDADTDADLIDRAKRVIDSRLLSLVGEVRGSLDYHAAQAGAAAVQRVLLTGGAALTEGLEVSLQALLALPVAMARPRERIDIADIGFDADTLPSLDPYLPVPLGLALGGGKADGRRISLLPGEARARAAERQQTVIVLMAAAIGLLLLLLVTFARAEQVAGQRDKAKREVAANHALQGRIDTLTDARNVEQQVTDAQQRVRDVLANDVSWSRMLADVARTIPNDVWLSSFQAQVAASASTASSPGAPAAGSPAASTPTSLSGSVSFAAVGLDFTSVASWIQRMGRLSAFAGLWVPTITKAELGTRTIVNFNSNASLTAAAHTDRVARYLGTAQ
jgi:type IV pilus assembly protein PilM